MSSKKTMYVVEIELKPGVSGADVEKIWVEEFLPHATDLPGFKPTLHKGRHGQREEQYFLVNYFKCDERANELFPNDTIGEEYQQWMSANPAFQKFMNHFYDDDRMINTYYQEIG